MSERPDYYAVLGVDRRASAHELHLAYRALARELHPDVTGDDGPMKLLNVAWEVLRDPSRRLHYDRESSAGEPSTEPIVTASPYRVSIVDDAAGGPVMDYGRYAGWRLADIAVADRPFLEWLRSVPSGRPLRTEIDRVLADLDASAAGFRARREAESRRTASRRRFGVLF